MHASRNSKLSQTLRENNELGVATDRTAHEPHKKNDFDFFE